MYRTENDTSRVWIVCAQTVFKRSYKPVGVYPLSPHNHMSMVALGRLIPRSVAIIRSVMRVLHTRLSTVKNQVLTGKETYLSPLSTPPITTTTTYIIRRGTAQ